MDALVMGRTTFETVCGFDIDRPYQKPVFVLSPTLTEIPEKVKGKAELVPGNLAEDLEQIHQKGHTRLYINGGKTVQSFLEADLIGELIVTLIPVLLKSGIPLFGSPQHQLIFKCTETTLFLAKIVQNRFVRKKADN